MYEPLASGLVWQHKARLLLIERPREYGEPSAGDSEKDLMSEQPMTFPRSLKVGISREHSR